MAPVTALVRVPVVTLLAARLDRDPLAGGTVCTLQRSPRVLAELRQVVNRVVVPGPPVPGPQVVVPAVVKDPTRPPRLPMAKAGREAVVQPLFRVLPMLPVD